MNELSVQLTKEEQDYLVNRLESALGEARVEARHTRLPGYREKVRQEEDLLVGLLNKLREPMPAGHAVDSRPS